MSAETVADSIPAGYKQTEVGVIPEDWDIKKFGEIAAPRNKRVNPRKDGCHDFCVELEHIASSTGSLLGHTSTSGQSSIKTIFQQDDVLFGKLRAYLRKYWHANCSGVCSTEIWVLTPLKDNIDNNYLYQIVQTDKFIEAASSTYGTHMPRSDWNVVNNYSLALPPTLTEQEAIATALSDTDALIESLEQLIAKKRQIKQGTMQELLTGKRRLPGFSGEWEVKELGDICDIAIGRTPSRLDSAFWGNGYKWLSIADLKSKIVVESKEEITTLAAAEMQVIPKGTLLMSFKLSIGRLCFAGCDLYTNEAICSFNNLKANAEFLYYILGRTDFSLYGKQAVKGYTLNKESLKLVKVPLPTIAEQSAIAAILSDMDSEITSLEEKLAKTLQIKQGMMQELLTGRIRLV